MATDILNFQKNAGGVKESQSLLLAIRLGDYSRILVNRAFWDASFKGYRQTDNFKTGIKKSGILDYWREHGFPPQCRAVGADDFACD